MNPEEVYATEAPRAIRSSVGVAGLAANAKTVGPHTSYLDGNAQENMVVLSPRLRTLIAQVGGCQTEHVEAVIRRVLYEVLNSKF